MPRIRKPKKAAGYFEAQDKVMRLHSIYRTEIFGGDRRKLTSTLHKDIDDVATPEPDEELEDAELSDNERQAAITRERMRREGYL